jgi:hypothetical protein
MLIALVVTSTAVWKFSTADSIGVSLLLEAGGIANVGKFGKIDLASTIRTCSLQLYMGRDSTDNDDDEEELFSDLTSIRIHPAGSTVYLCPGITPVIS